PINLLVYDQPPANAAADGDVENRRQSLAGADQGLGQAGTVGVVAQHRRQAEHFGDPVGQWKAGPALDRMRFADAARRVIHWAPAPDAGAAELPGLEIGLLE